MARESSVRSASADSPQAREAGARGPSARRLYKRLWFRIPLYLLLAYCATCVGLYLCQDRLLFPADMAPPPLGAPFSRDAVVTRLSIGDGGQVESWFFPAPGASAEHPAPAVMYFHGNAEIIDQMEPVVDLYRRMGISVLLPEYRGYGSASGRPSEEALVADAVRFYDELAERRDVDRSRIVFHGRSLGGGVAAQVAARRRPAALILESTFTSVAAMAHRYGAPGFLAKHPFRTDRVVRDLDIPILIFHGANDDIVPVSHGRRLRDLARRGTYVEYPVGHNDLSDGANAAAVEPEIRTFLQRTAIIPAAAP